MVQAGTTRAGKPRRELVGATGAGNQQAQQMKEQAKREPEQMRFQERAGNPVAATRGAGRRAERHLIVAQAQRHLVVRERPSRLKEKRCPPRRSHRMKPV